MTDKSEISEVLSSNYMLATLTVRSWSGHKKDNEATAELLQSHGATANAASVVKSLLAGNDKELQDTRAAYSRIRTWFYANSLPWTSGDGQRGSRLVGTTQAMTFLRDFANLKNDAEKARDDFLAVYDDAVKNSAATLGSLYDPSQYPTKDQVRYLFGATLDILPLPDVADFDRVSIPGPMATGLKRKYELQAAQHAENALAEMQERLLEQLDRMATQLTKVAKSEKVRLRKSLMTSLRTVADLARSMAPLAPNMEQVAARIEDELLNHELGDYKNSITLAEKGAEAARSIAEQVSGTQQKEPDDEPPTQSSADTPQAPADFDPDSVFF